MCKVITYFTINFILIFKYLIFSTYTKKDTFYLTKNVIPKLKMGKK